MPCPLCEGEPLYCRTPTMISAHCTHGYYTYAPAEVFDAALARIISPAAMVCGYIELYSAAHGYPPSLREIGEALGKNHMVIHRWVNRLVRGGYLAREPGHPRTLRIVRFPE